MKKQDKQDMKMKKKDTFIFFGNLWRFEIFINEFLSLAIKNPKNQFFSQVKIFNFLFG